jgi:hypothetical protein
MNYHAFVLACFGGVFARRLILAGVFARVNYRSCETDGSHKMHYVFEYKAKQRKWH